MQLVNNNGYLILSLLFFYRPTAYMKIILKTIKYDLLIPVDSILFLCLLSAEGMPGRSGRGVQLGTAREIRERGGVRCCQGDQGEGCS